MEKQPYNNENTGITDETETTAESREIPEAPGPELSAKQEQFLNLVDAERLLSLEWGASERPKIGYFGIVSEKGVLAFNADGQKIMHEIMSDDTIDNIRKSSAAWEKLLAAKILEIVKANNRRTVNGLRDAELAKVMAEKDNLMKLKNSQRDETERLKGKEPGAESDKETDALKNRHNAARDTAFREFALRRGWYSDDSTFKLLDARKGRYGLSHTPEFAAKIDPEDYQNWLRKLFAANERKLSPTEERTDGGGTSSRVIERDENKNPVDWEKATRGKTLAELASEMVDLAGENVRPEIAEMNDEIAQYITLKDVYRRRKRAWWSGSFAEELGGKRRIYPAFSEISRINKHFEKALSRLDAISDKEVPSKTAAIKMKLCEKALGGVRPEEAYILPTGIVAYQGEEKMTKAIPVFDEGTAGVDNTALSSLWKASWTEYASQNISRDTAKLSHGINKHMDSVTAPSPAKELFSRYNIQYNDDLIDEQTGYFLPHIDSHERKAIEPFWDKYGGFIGSIEYSDTARRFDFSISDWRKGLMKNAKGVNPNAPSFARDAFLSDGHGLNIILDNVPADAGDDISVLAAAAKTVIWDGMNAKVKESFMNMWGEKLNIKQSVFVKLFGEFMYNALRRREVVARALFFNQFAKWQSGKLDGEEKDFFDRLEEDFKHPPGNGQ